MNTRERTEWLERRAAERARNRGGVRPGAAALHRGVYAPVTQRVPPIAKEDPIQHAGYEKAVRDLGYCVRCGWQGRPQFCHRDQGKGAGIKTDVREGWAGCDFCHALLGGHKGGVRLPKEERRAEELRLAALTRDAVLASGTWPALLPMWEDA